MLGVNVGMWLLSIVVFIYVGSGGLRAVAYVDTIQCIMKGIKWDKGNQGDGKGNRGNKGDNKS